MHKAIALLFLLTATSAHATRYEDNAEDVYCEWNNSSGQSGTDVCHIISQGTGQGETGIAFRIGNGQEIYIVSDSGLAEIKIGEDVVWTGRTVEFGEDRNSPIKISNGMSFRFYYQ